MAVSLSRTLDPHEHTPAYWANVDAALQLLLAKREPYTTRLNSDGMRSLDVLPLVLVTAMLSESNHYSVVTRNRDDTKQFATSVRAYLKRAAATRAVESCVYETMRDGATVIHRDGSRSTLALVSAGSPERELREIGGDAVLVPATLINDQLMRLVIQPLLRNQVSIVFLVKDK